MFYVFSSYRALIGDVLSQREGMDVGICSILQRGANHYTGGRWNQTVLPQLQEDVAELNERVRSLALESHRTFFIDYQQYFVPDTHLGRDGLHVNREGAQMITAVIEAHLAERLEVQDAVPIIETLSIPTPTSPETAVMTYADAVRQKTFTDQHQPDQV